MSIGKVHVNEWSLCEWYDLFDGVAAERAGGCRLPARPVRPGVRPLQAALEAELGVAAGHEDGRSLPVQADDAQVLVINLWFLY